MTNLEKYFIQINEYKLLLDGNSKYNDVSIEILCFEWPLQPDTRIVEKWHNGKPDQEFRSIEFKYSEMAPVTRKIYDKTRYLKTMNKSNDGPVVKSVDT